MTSTLGWVVFVGVVIAIALFVWWIDRRADQPTPEKELQRPIVQPSTGLVGNSLLKNALLAASRNVVEQQQAKDRAEVDKYFDEKLKDFLLTHRQEVLQLLGIRK